MNAHFLIPCRIIRHRVVVSTMAHLEIYAAIYGIFSLKWIHYGPKGDILDYQGNTHILVYYPIIYYQRI